MDDTRDGVSAGRGRRQKRPTSREVDRRPLGVSSTRELRRLEQSLGTLFETFSRSADRVPEGRHDRLGPGEASNQMTTDSNPISDDPIETALRALEKRDAVAAASAFAPDGRFVDPRFPDPEYRGRESIREALEWALTNLVDGDLEFAIRRFLAHDGTYALEVETRQVRPDDSTLETPKAFVVEVADSGIERWWTYLPSASPDGHRDESTPDDTGR